MTAPHGQEGSRDFDFLRGSWRVANRRLRSRLAGSDDWEVFEALVDNTPILGGAGNIDRFRADRDGTDYEALALRVYDPATARWSIYWVDTAGFELGPPVAGGFVAGEGEFFGDDTHEGRDVLVRFRWSEIGPESARWEQAFSEDDSLGLIASRAPGVVAEHEGACRKMARALDGLPLALRVAADLPRVESEAGLDVSGLLVELTEAARVLGEEAPHDAEAEEAARTVRALLRKSIERLDGDAVRRFARLGVLPPKPLSFDPWAADDVWRDAPRDLEQEDSGSEEEQAGARRALGELVRRGLVESAAFGVDPLAVKLDLRSKRPERFWTHALVSAFALETLERTEGEGGAREAQLRRLEHYRRVVLAANEAARLGGDNQYFGVLLMSLDLPNIRAAHGWARARSSSDRQALEYLSRLPTAGRRVLLERLAPDEFLDWLTLAEESARAIGDEDEARSHREAAGAALLMKGQLREALSYCEESFRASRTRGDPVGMATALANCASIRNSMGAHGDALDLARRAETALGDADAPDVLLGAIGQQAEALEGLGRVAEAEERYGARRDLARREGELSYYARALRGLARIKRERPEERDEAREMYDEVAQVFRDLRDHWGYRGALNGKGALEMEAGSLEAAEKLFGRALASAVDDEHEGDQAREDEPRHRAPEPRDAAGVRGRRGRVPGGRGPGLRLGRARPARRRSVQPRPVTLLPGGAPPGRPRGGGHRGRSI